MKISFIKTPRYKFRFHYLLRQLSVEDYEIAMEWFPIRLGIHPKTWQKWIYIKFDDHSDVPATAFFTIAVFFDVHPRDLFENPIDEMSIGEAFEAFRAKNPLMDARNSTVMNLRFDKKTQDEEEELDRELATRHFQEWLDKEFPL